jgi:uncharacterized Ntn-hydrolase superfamily protein
MTFSITARCPLTGAFGVAVTSSSPAVAARCAHVRAGVGAVATQNITDPRLGPRGLELMAAGATAPEALARLLAETPHGAFRQLALVDRGGRTAQHSGERTLGRHGWAARGGAVAAGNLLADPAVPEAMLAAFEAAAPAPLAARLLAALAAGRDAGGEAGPLHSAGLVVAADVAWPVADLRIDWTEGDPVAELAALWARWEPEMAAYVARALDPAAAPAFGVPGEA